MLTKSVSLRGSISFQRTAPTTRDVTMPYTAGGGTASPAAPYRRCRISASRGRRCLPRFQGLMLLLTGTLHDDPRWSLRNLDPDGTSPEPRSRALWRDSSVDAKPGRAFPNSTGRGNAMDFTTDPHEVVARALWLGGHLPGYRMGIQRRRADRAETPSPNETMAAYPRSRFSTRPLRQETKCCFIL